MFDILVMQVEIALALAFFSGAAAFGIGRDNRHRCHARPGMPKVRVGYKAPESTEITTTIEIWYYRILVVVVISVNTCESKTNM